jgi:hypothetical protein
MNVRARIAVLSFASLIILASQISLSFAPYSSTKTVAASGTIVYPTYIVSTLTQLTDVISTVVPGNTVFIRGGVYQLTSRLTFQVSGTSSSPITYEAYPNETVVLDGSLSALRDEYTPLLRVNGNWNILRNIEVRNSPVSGIFVYGDNCVLDHVETHNNRGIGANTWGNNCHFLYCVSYDNSDPDNPRGLAGEDADGLGSNGDGAYFFGCQCYNNSDDGFDYYGGTNSILENCVSHNNGYLPYGDGRGYVLAIGGGNHLSNCIAYNNSHVGFAADDTPAPDNVVDHCTGYNNGGTDFECAFESSDIFTNNIGSFSSYLATPTHYDNTWDLGITNYGFVSTDTASTNFLSLQSNSQCRGKASDGSDLGALQFGEKISDLLGT